MTSLRENGWLIGGWIMAFLATWLVRDHVFFWDTVQLGSKHAHWYYENDFHTLLLPEQFDSGHPPVFGMYLAVLWQWFGKSLPVSHFAMLPFLFGIIFFLWKIGAKLTNRKFAPFLLLLAFADPVLAAQSLLASPDVALVCFFLMGVWGIFTRQNGWKVLAALGLAMISMRGMMTVVVLFLFDWLAYRESKPLLQMKTIFQKVLPYVPAGLFGLAFLIWHYRQTGWIGYHPDSPWTPSFERVDLPGFAKNIAVLGWRLLDFGRVFVWLVIGGTLLYLWRAKQVKKLWQNKQMRRLVGLFLLALLVLTPSLLLYKGLSAHRYLLPVFLSLTLIAFVLIFKHLQSKRIRLLAFGIAFIGLLTGNSWIYPDKISQGWDSTLAHLPYYDLRAQMLDYIESERIPLDAVGTAFPEIGALKYRDLSGRETGFAPKDLQRQSYILYSNVMNDYSDAEIDSLKQNWTLVQEFSQWGVRVALYKNNFSTK